MSKDTAAVSPGTVAGRGDRRWLLVYNCQARGLTHCLGLLGRGLRVDGFEVPAVQADPAAVARMLGNYERVLLLPQVRAIPGFDTSAHASTRDLPSFVFSGYHPDLFRLGDASGLRQGPLGNFHSLLAYGGWRLGRAVDATAALFRTDVFEALGYLAGWTQERDAMLGRFSRAGLDLRAEFLAWSRRGPFMYNPIHPRIELLRDLARKLLQEGDVPCRETDLLPHDNLAAGAVFPVYPGIAGQLGIQGSFVFKPQGRYEAFGLEEFIERSFKSFDAFPDVGPVAGDNARVSTLIERLVSHA